MLKVVQEHVSSTATGGVAGSLLDELARDGARAMLAAALAAEVAAYVDGHADQVDADGRRLVVRNSSHAERQVTTAAGAVTVKAPRVNDKRTDEATGERCRVATSLVISSFLTAAAAGVAELGLGATPARRRKR